MRGLSACVLSVLFVLSACDDGASSDPALNQGALGEACYPNQTCDDGLWCAPDGRCAVPEGDAARPEDDATTPAADAADAEMPHDANLADMAPIVDAYVFDAAPTGCDPERPCPGDQTCDQDGACVEAAPCRIDVDCFEGRRCFDAQCTDPCLEDTDCPGTRACVNGRCPEPDICLTPEDCDAGRICQDGACLAACAQDDQCPGTLYCDLPAGLCREIGACEDNSGCEGARVCAADECVEPCAADEDCEGTRTCDPVTRVCPEPEFCFVSEDCDGERACVSGLCTDTCLGARPCPGGQQCDQALGLCTEPDVCVADEDCRALRVCDAGQCHNPCAADADCPGAQICDAESGHCEAAEGCGSDEDCPGLALCGPDGACFMPECAENDDCAAACVDRSCAHSVPMACVLNGDCPDEQICAQGACVLDGPCEADADCPVGTPLCDPIEARCIVCNVDDDCADNETCEAGLCVHGGACDEDSACPGDRVCEGGQCVPSGACEGDEFDLNPVAEQLMHRTYTNLLLCDGAEDHYTLHLPAGQGVRIMLRHDPSLGDLSLAAHRTGAQEVFLSDLRHGVEQVGFQPAAEDRSLEVMVAGRPGHSVPYQLTVEALPDGFCVLDALEGLLRNDDADHATPLGTGTYDLALCPGEQDWLSLNLAAGSHVSVQLEKTGPRAQVSLSDPEGAPMAQIWLDDEIVTLEADTQRSGAHLLRFSADGAASPVEVRLHVEVWSASEALACEAAVPLFSNVPVTPAERLPVSRLSVSCSATMDPEALFQFTLEAPSMVTLRATGGTALAVRATCDDANTERACVEMPSPVLHGLPLEAGTWFVVLKTDGRTHPALTLQTQAMCLADVDCGAGVCDGGLCHASCLVDAACPGSQTCDAESGHCVEPHVCSVDIDCLGARRCRHDGICFTAECETNDDCAGACVDEICLDSAPTACVGDADCPGTQTCTALGVCALEGPCAGDDDCPAGTPICQIAEGRCAVCTADAHCLAGERCDAGRCLYIGVCEDAGDCPGDRLCPDRAMCVPSGACVGDRFDALADPPALVARTYGGLTLCDGDEDRYRLQVPPGEAMKVVLRYDSLRGDLSLELNALAPAMMQIGFSDAQAGVESLHIDAELLGGNIDVAVQGRAGFDTPYTLTVERVDPDACVPDALEGLTGNDDEAHATALVPGTHHLSICADDEDWFAIDLAAGTRLSARARPDAPAALAMSLARAGQPALTDAVDDAGAWALDADIAESGRHVLRLWAPEEAADVNLDLVLSVEAAPNAVALACGSPTPLSAGTPLQFASTLRVLRFELGCGFGMPGLSADYLASFTLAAPATVSLAASNGSTVALRSVCGDIQSERTCAFSGDAALEHIALAAGTWYVIVQRMEPEAPQLELTIH